MLIYIWIQTDPFTRIFWDVPVSWCSLSLSQNVPHASHIVFLDQNRKHNSSDANDQPKKTILTIDEFRKFVIVIIPVKSIKLTININFKSHEKYSHLCKDIRYNWRMSFLFIYLLIYNNIVRLKDYGCCCVPKFSAWCHFVCSTQTKDACIYYKYYILRTLFILWTIL